MLFPELQRTYPDGANPEEYFFSTEERPPRHVKVWYETGPHEVTPGFAVSLRAEGLMSDAQLALDIAGRDSRLIGDLAIAEDVAANSGMAYQTELPVDPQTLGPEVAHAVALDAARHLFTIATIQSLGQ